MFEYNHEYALSAKSLIYLLLHLVCRGDKLILDKIYHMKQELETDEIKEILKDKRCPIIRKSLLRTQIQALYPGYIMYIDEKKNVRIPLLPFNKGEFQISGIYEVNYRFKNFSRGDTRFPSLFQTDNFREVSEVIKDGNIEEIEEYIGEGVYTIEELNSQWWGLQVTARHSNIYRT